MDNNRNERDRIRNCRKIDTPANDVSDSNSNTGDFFNDEDDPSYVPEDWDWDSDDYENRSNPSHIFESITIPSESIDENTVHEPINA